MNTRALTPFAFPMGSLKAPSSLVRAGFPTGSTGIATVRQAGFSGTGSCAGACKALPFAPPPGKTPRAPGLSLPRPLSSWCSSARTLASSAVIDDDSGPVARCTACTASVADLRCPSATSSLQCSASQALSRKGIQPMAGTQIGTQSGPGALLEPTPVRIPFQLPYFP